MSTWGVKISIIEPKIEPRIDSYLVNMVGGVKIYIIEPKIEPMIEQLSYQHGWGSKFL